MKILSQRMMKITRMIIILTEALALLMNKINQKSADGTQSTVAKSEAPAESADNSGTLILDATCAPSNIRYPQDFSLLNEAREKLEKIIRVPY